MASRSSLESLFSRQWRKKGWLTCLLWPLSIVFGLLTAVRRQCYAKGLFTQARMPVPVIVVGNIYVGGTGKTPLVIWLVRQLRQQGWVPGVISRGHGGDADRVLEVQPDMSPEIAGDEPLLIVRSAEVPLFIGRHRAAAARALLAAHSQVNVLIADDGLQHYALARDIEILLSDERGTGNGWLLPAGPLREPASRRCDFRVLHGMQSADPNASVMQLQGEQAQQLIDRGQSKPLTAWPSGTRIAAAAGIGHPERFFGMLRQRGVMLAATLPLPDHFDYGSNPFADLDAEVILITEKDAVKCLHNESLATDPRLWVVPVQAVITGPLSEHLVEKLRGYPTA